MRMRLVPVLALMTVLPSLATAQVKQPQSTRLNTDGNAAVPFPRQPVAQVYTHPKLGFAVVAPPGAQITEKAGGQQISIRSKRGFAIKLQSGTARPDIPLTSMSSLLETKYLGRGKAWTARGKDRSLSVAGLPAHEVIYTGNTARARVVVVRGAKNDYVFIFMAPLQHFDKLSHEFKWVLNSFKPAIEDRVAARKVAPERHATVASAAKPNQRFSAPGFGYVIEYPRDWVFNKPANMAAMFSGREGTPAFAVIVGVQNIQPTGAKNGDESVQRAMNQLKSSLGNMVWDLRTLSDSSWTYQHDGRRLQGQQMIVTYLYGGERFMKHLIAIPRPQGTVAHVWSYTAPERQFAAFQPVASQMLSSWRILSSETR